MKTERGLEVISFDNNIATKTQMESSRHLALQFGKVAVVFAPSCVGYAVSINNNEYEGIFSVARRACVGTQ